MVFVKFSLLLAVCLALSYALPVQQFRKTGHGKNGGNSTRVSGTYGIDLSSYFDESDFECLKSNSYEFAIIRGYQSIGQVDPNAADNIRHARAAGIQSVDVYMFPCPRTCGKSASAQVKEMVDALSGSDYGQIWLDIEGSQNWMNSYENQKFFEELLSTAREYKTTGVYSSESQWSSIMGSDYTGGSSAQLWYVHWDGNASFSDFKPFGGWTTPTIKQYKDNAEECEVNIDKNWY